MSDDAYRSAYRVETRVRDLTSDEAALVDARRREWDTHVRRQAMARVRELVFALPFAIGLVILAARSGWDGVVFSAGMMTVLFALLAFVARRQALKTIAAARSPWLGPEGGWKMRDTRVIARSTVKAHGGADPHAIWLLFEIPGGTWFYIDTFCLPPDKKDLSRANVQFTRLWPDSMYFAVTASGDAIPMGELDDDTWDPSDDAADGMIEEKALPAALLNTRVSTP